VLLPRQHWQVRFSVQSGRFGQAPEITRVRGLTIKENNTVPGKAVVAFCAVGCALGLYALYVASHANAPPPVGKVARGAAKSGFKVLSLAHFHIFKSQENWS